MTEKTWTEKTCKFCKGRMSLAWPSTGDGKKGAILSCDGSLPWSVI